MSVYLKLTGEAMAPDGQMGWGINAVMEAAEQVAELHTYAGKVGLGGVVVIVGGGNHMRKRDFAEPWVKEGRQVPEPLLKAADLVGRWGTVDNCDMLSGAIQGLGVASRVLLAPGMERRDGAAGVSQVNSLENIFKAQKNGEAIENGGGTGEDGCSTDAAVAELARREAKFRLVRNLSGLVIAVKATGVDKVCNRDPRTPSDEPLIEYDEIYAEEMLKDPKRFGIIDERCQRALASPDAATVQFHVYNRKKHTPVEVVRGIVEGLPPVGTRILTGPMPQAA